MLLPQHARSERFGRVFAAHRHRGLNDNRSAIELRRDEMNAAAMHLRPSGEYTLMGAQTWERGQQGRMNIEQLLLVARHEPGREHAHESGEHDQSRRNAVDLAGERGVEFLPARKTAMPDEPGRHAPRGRGFEDLGFGFAADDRGDRQPGIEQRMQVAAPARNEHRYGHEPLKEDSRVASWPGADHRLRAYPAVEIVGLDVA